jgi:hypothetical protein
MMREWLPLQDDFQHAILSLEGRGTDDSCTSCQATNAGKYRCEDCYHSGLLCQECCVAYHARHPFHSIRQWTGKYFQSVALQALGFVLHLGHGGSPCPAYNHRYDNSGREFTVVDVDGVYTHRVAWCECTNGPERWKQLLQAKLYPASIQYPKTAFTFRQLQYYGIDTLECGVTASSFMTKLRRLTNLHHPETVAVCSICLLVEFRQCYLPLIHRIEAGSWEESHGNGTTWRPSAHLVLLMTQIEHLVLVIWHGFA